MAREPKPASADDVRAWAQEMGWKDQYGRPVADRGRMPTTLITDFDQAHRRNNVKYMPGYKPQGQPGKDVATRREQGKASAPAAKETKKDTAPAKQTRQEQKQDPARTPTAERVSAAKVVNGPAGNAALVESVADAIANLRAAKTANPNKEPALGAVYFLV